MPNDKSIKFGEDVLEQPGANYSRDGIFTNASPILSAHIGYGVAAYEGWNPNDLVLKITTPIEGQDFNKDLLLGGDYEWSTDPEGNNVVTGMKSAFRIWDLIKILRQNGHLKESWAPLENGHIAVGGKELLPEDGESLIDVSDYFANAIVVYIDYLTDQPRKDDPTKMKTYSYRNITAVYPNETPTDAEERLKGRFKKDLAAGYVKNYAQPGSAASNGGSTDSYAYEEDVEAPWEK